MSIRDSPVRLRRLLAAPAVVFSAWALIYTVPLILAGAPQPEVELGFNAEYRPNDRDLVITEVFTPSPAEDAGMKTGDRIVAIDGQPIENERSQPAAWSKHRAGDLVHLTILRPGVAGPVVLTGTFRRRTVFGDATFVAQRVQKFYPVPFVVVGLVVLFLRLDDRIAWLLALLFGSFATIPDFPGNFASVVPALRPIVIAYRSLLLGLLGPLFYTFFAVFPAASPIDRRVPWLKWAGVLGGLAIGLPGIGDNQLRLPPPLESLAGRAFSVQLPGYFEFAFLTLGLASLATNYAAAARDTDAMRKIRVIFWGTIIGLTPALVAFGFSIFAGISAGARIDTFTSGALYVIPLSFAYAVVKHRVLDIPVLVKRSARYLLVQRGFAFLVSIATISLTLLSASSFTRYVPSVHPSAGILFGAVFGTTMLWGGLQVHRKVGGRIDRAFFRSAYDARVILEDLAEKTGAAGDRETIGRLLERHLTEALHPEWLVACLEGQDGRLSAVIGPAGVGLGTLARSDVALVRLAERGEPWDVSSSGADGIDGASALAELGPECLVPILGRDRRLIGLLVLGRRLSEEPYSGEDRRLLASVARQTGTALENIRLAEEIAQRMESERRVAREMDIAREVQARLLPEAPLPLATLDYAARCVQAREVGGDGYDILDLGPGYAGLVLADVSGKGIHAALLMANLQAHLRSQSGIAPRDPVGVLTAVNRLMFRSTATQHYATVFFGVYEEDTRRLRYVNCGLNPPVLLRSRAGAEPIRLRPTAPVIGLFQEWEGHVDEVTIDPGDLLALFSDGVTEAMREDAEFGEARFVEELYASRERPAAEIVETILASVQQFSAGAPSDDLTLVVARGR